MTYKKHTSRWGVLFFLLFFIFFQKSVDFAKNATYLNNIIKLTLIKNTMNKLEKYLLIELPICLLVGATIAYMLVQMA